MCAALNQSCRNSAVPQPLRHPPLAPGVEQITNPYNLQTVLVSDDSKRGDLARTARVLGSRDGNHLDRKDVAVGTLGVEYVHRRKSWTDDYRSRFKILR